MDLLSTILRSCNAEKYIDNFRKHQINSFTLKLLNDEDLEIIGIDSEEERYNILKQIENLQIPAEKKVNTTVDQQYMLLVLNQISLQLHKHYAVLTYDLKRNDVDLCNVLVAPAATCLQNCMYSMEKELEKFENNITKAIPKKRKSKFHLVIFPTIVATSLALVLCRFYIVYTR